MSRASVSPSFGLCDTRRNYLFKISLALPRDLPVSLLERPDETAHKMARKKALLIGINYTGTENELNGCHNDVENVRDFLVNDRGFSDDSKDMVIMTDTPDNEGTPFWPSGENILAAFKWLTSYNRDGDILWLSYSGHGGMKYRKTTCAGAERRCGLTTQCQARSRTRMMGGRRDSTTRSALSTLRRPVKYPARS